MIKSILIFTALLFHIISHLKLKLVLVASLMSNKVSFSDPINAFPSIMSVLLLIQEQTYILQKQIY